MKHIFTMIYFRDFDAKWKIKIDPIKKQITLTNKKDKKKMKKILELKLNLKYINNYNMQNMK